MRTINSKVVFWVPASFPAAPPSDEENIFGVSAPEFSDVETILGAVRTYLTGVLRSVVPGSH